MDYGRIIVESVILPINTLSLYFASDVKTHYCYQDLISKICIDYRLVFFLQIITHFIAL